MAARSSVSFPQFFYRINVDQTIDAICAYCYLTAATARNEDDVRRLVRAHHCPADDR